MSPDTIVLIAAISLFILGYIYLLIKIPQLESVGGRLGKWNIRVFGFLFGSLVITYLFYKLSEIQPNEWVEISLLAGLVGATSALAVYAAGQAYTSAKMAEEMRQQRRPIVIQEIVPTRSVSYALATKDIEKSISSDYFEIHNEGNGPAIELEIILLDQRESQKQKETKTFLSQRSETKLPFYPEGLESMENSTCYLLCRYRGAFSPDEGKVWYETWLPFVPVKSQRGDRIIIRPRELEFRVTTEKKSY